MDDFPSRPLNFERYPAADMATRSATFLEQIRERRSVRHFSDEPIPMDVVRSAIETAGQAPSGANKQPWTFVLVTCPETKKKVRIAAETEERKFYNGLAPQEWLDDLVHIGTTAHKPYLEEAPALIAVFAQTRADGGGKHYYVKESVGLATGFLLAALQHAGLATLTHTPSPMEFLQQILGRPKTERAYLLIPVGYPIQECEVPDIPRKDLTDYLVEI